MLLCGVSDMHGDLNINIPECDVLCICGDIINLNDQRDIPASKKWWETRFIEWVKSLPCSKVIVTPGNHDFFLERMYTECWGWFKDRMRLLSNKKLEFLIDESFYYEYIHFYGTPWIEPIEFQESRWAFEKNFNENPVLIPKCDVLLTHDSPYKNGILGVNSTIAEYHLFGHWHDGEDNSLLGRFNCSILDDMYNRKKKFKCVIINIMTDTQKKKIEQDFLDKIINKAKEIIASNEIANADIMLDYLLNFKEHVDETPIHEDEIPWDTSAKVLESAIITDFSD